MRIGLVISELDRQSGGLGSWCGQFVDALAKRGDELHIISQRFNEAPPAENVVRHTVPKSKSRMHFAEAAERIVRNLEPNIIHDMGAGWHCDIFQPHGGSHDAWLARKADMHAPWFRAVKRPVDALLPRHRDFVRHCRRQFATSDVADKTFIALSQTVADDFAHYHHIRPEQIAVVYNGVDCRRFSPDHRAQHRDVVRRKVGVDDQTLLLLLAAHNLRLKGLPELLAVTARLVSNQRPVHLAVVGGKRLARWRRRAARHGLENHVTFLGAVSDLVPCYAAADAYVHPTYYDPCSLVLLEAAASGLPIVTTRRCNGAAELFRDGSDILTIADPRDGEALYECVEALVDERLRTKLGCAAREVALRHSFERNVAEIRRLYDLAACRRIAA